MLKHVRNFAMLAMLAVGAFAASGMAYAQQNCSCVIVDGCKVVTFYDEFDNPISTETICSGTGTGDFDCAKEPPPTGPLNLSLPPVAITAKGQSPTFGTITTRIDPSRPSSNARIVSRSEKERFPLSVEFSFYAITTVAGEEFYSETELVFRSDDVHSFHPFQQEKFCLKRDVRFRSVRGTSIVLEAGKTCVTLN